MLTNHKYSFLQFDLQSPFQFDNISLPARLYFLPGDVLFFQFSLGTGYNINEFQLIDKAGNSQAEAVFDSSNSNGVFGVNLTVPGVALGVYSLALEVETSGDSLNYFTQKFEIISLDDPRTKYTELIRYWNNSGDAFGFVYPENSLIYHNQIRLPLKVHSPQFSREQQVYRKSDGDTVKLKALQSKLFEVESYGNEPFHEALAVTFMHENLEIVSGARQGKYINSEAYEIEWGVIDKRRFSDTLLVKAKTKLTVDEYAVANPLYGLVNEPPGSGSSSGSGSSGSDNNSSSS